MTLDEYENNTDQEAAVIAPPPPQQPAYQVPTYQEIQAYAQLEAEKAVAASEFKKAHPELLGQERYIQQDAEAYAIEEMHKGNYVSPAEALRHGVERFKATLPKAATEKAPEEYSPLYQMLETGNESTAMSGTQRATKIETMSASDFRKLSDSLTV